MAGSRNIERGRTRVSTALLYVRAIRRPLRAARLSPTVLGRLDGRMVFVFGSPRSGTTFFAGALGCLPGFVDLGEVSPLKAALPELSAAEPEQAVARLRRTLGIVRRLGLVGAQRAVEQTPETAFALPAVARAFPEATLIHLVRDGRDVVCSLLERGWLSGERGGVDDAGAAYGAHARFWVEPGREREFETASEARRAAWAWRRYVTSARESSVPVQEVRYEQLATDPDAVADELAGVLGARREELRWALSAAESRSVGRYRRDLNAEQLEDVEREAGGLLAELGYARAEVAR